MDMRYREIVLVGVVTDGDVELVKELAKARGFQVFSAPGALRPEVAISVRSKANADLPPPTWSDNQLHAVQLPEAIESFHLHGIIRPVLWRDGIQDAADLTRLRFEEFMRFPEGITQEFYARAHVLEFMIKHGIRFSNLVPRAAFPTRTDDVEELSELTAMLGDAGIYRLELLAFFMRKELKDIRHFGPKRIDLVEQALTNIGLGFSAGR